ncbi:hypothetical protein NQ317_013058 [Molorchus minor]|uniref:Shootin-1 n=1 Tax=Molorchus minor TaxID=1323400 RepID=A0ABQ9K4C3_9CUCU|nr:hypothetical protein NQ317_013058 [Molorchus minor]
MAQDHTYSVTSRFVGTAMHNNRHTISFSKLNGNSNIPLRKQLSRQSSGSGIPSKIPVNDPQAHRALNDVEKKYLNMQVKHEHLETELFEKNEEFTKLSTASKNLYKEYETLKNQYETETRAMSGALKDATHWYKENKALKRKTLLLLDTDAVDEGVDAGDGEPNSENDIENLNKTIKQLSTEVAELQTEVDSLKQTEFQTSEENARLSEELEKRETTKRTNRIETKRIKKRT